MTKLEALLEIRAAVALAPGLITGAYISHRGVCAVGAAACGPHARHLTGGLRLGLRTSAEVDKTNALLSALSDALGKSTDNADWIPYVNDRFVGSPAARRAYMLTYLDNRIAYHREHQGEPSPVEPMPTPAPQVPVAQEAEPVTV